jgi:hypothetical protein
MKTIDCVTKPKESPTNLAALTLKRILFFMQRILPPAKELYLLISWGFLIMQPYEQVVSQTVTHA